MGSRSTFFDDQLFTRRQALQLLGVSAAGAVMAACGGGLASTGPREIVFWHSFGGGLGENLEKMVTKFNESQKDVKVRLEFQGSSYNELLQKLLAALAADNAPDVTLLTQIVELAKNGVAQPLDEYMTGKDGVQVTDYNQALLRDAQFQGKTYAVPFARSTPVLYYNADMFQAAGLDPIQVLSKWENLVTQGPKLVKKEGNETRAWAYAAPPAWWFWSQKIWAFGGELSDPDGKPRFNEPAGVEATQFWQDIIHKHGVAKSYPAGVGFEAWTAGANDWLNQRVAVVGESTAQLTNYAKNAKFKVGVAPLPGQKANAVPTGGASLLMLARSKNKDAAWKFLKWMTTPEATSEWHIATGYMPMRNSAQNSQQLQDWFKTNPNHKVAIEQMKVAKATPVITAMSKFDSQVVRPTLEKILLQKAEVKPTLDQAAKLTADLWKEFNA